MSLLSGTRVLVVEDEAILSLTLQDMLVDLGCVIAGTAARLETALQISAKEVMARIEAHLKIARVRSEAAAKLGGQAERLRIIQDQAPVGIYENDMEGNFLRVKALL